MTPKGLVSASLLALALAVGASSAGAEPPAQADTATTVVHSTAMDHRFGIGGYMTGWEGEYGGAGVGGRVHWRVLSWLGLDLFADHLAVESEGGLRHDHPVGFNLSTPIRVSKNIQLRPLFGMCAVFSFIEPDRDDAPRADDILFGIHAGAGLTFGFAERWSVFADVKATGYAGHDRTAQMWTGGVDNEVSLLAVVQASTGVQLHFDLGGQ